MTLTEEMLRRCYEFLCSTDPFVKWNLPDSEDVRFILRRTKTSRGMYAQHYVEGDRNTIEISQGKHGHINTLLATMAHEMVHLHMWEAGMAGNAEHGKAFYRIANQVCKSHGYDPKAF